MIILVVGGKKIAIHLDLEKGLIQRKSGTPDSRTEVQIWWKATCFILREVLQKIHSVSQAITWMLLLTTVCEKLSLPVPHWFLSAALWWRESRSCHYLPPFPSVCFQSPGACAPSWLECEWATDPSLGEGPIPGLLPHLLHHMTGCSLLQDIEVLRKDCHPFSR